jgi:pimeloyl-ACP methyl ester carboxylesterase/adenylate cyclase class IV
VPRNVEIKIRAGDLGRMRKRLRALGASGPETVHQRDAFYSVPRGRLKLGEIDAGGAELIFYDRPDDTGPRLSSYSRAACPDPAALGDLLGSALGTRGVVEKLREVYRIGTSRVHLDRVRGLGDFVEIEVVLEEGQPVEEGDRRPGMSAASSGLVSGERRSGRAGGRVERGILNVIRVREYGESGPRVLVLHGGPGAPGSMAPVARGLAGSFRVLEPLQRRSGREPLTVARHVEDLAEVIRSRCADGAVAVVGHSWGAMLALAHAAAYPGQVESLALVGCGTFDPGARARMRANVRERVDPQLQQRLDRLAEEFPDPNERLRATGDLLLRPYSYDTPVDHLECERCDARGYRETWNDMLRLQGEGVYPAAFRTIEAPVLMLHGAVDPHPGAMIRSSLEPHLSRLEFHEWERCGHYPWLERHVRDDFFDRLRLWLSR